MLQDVLSLSVQLKLVCIVGIYPTQGYCQFYDCQYIHNENMRRRWMRRIHGGHSGGHIDGWRLGLRIIAYLSWISLVLFLVVLHVLILSANPASVEDAHVMIACLQVDSSAVVVSSVDSVVTEFLLDTEDLVELGKTL